MLDEYRKMGLGSELWILPFRVTGPRLWKCVCVCVCVFAVILCAVRHLYHCAAVLAVYNKVCTDGLYVFLHLA